MADEVIAGRYRLEERLGVGGMAEVWSAEDRELGRRVAIKLLASEADPARFAREARSVAALAHPNVCALYDYGESGGRPFIVLEYLPGGTLEDQLAPGRPLPDADTARIAAGVAAGLAHAHSRGLVHRDLKPSNILFDAEGRAKIADFGIARLGEEGTLTEAGTLLGSAAYISPEQAGGEPATAASDVYSFGVILYRMLAGRLPFESDDALELVARHRNEPPPPLTSFRPDAPPRLESVATAALAKSPADRPPHGAALLAELGEPRHAGGLDIPLTQVLRAPRGRGRRTLLAALAGAALLAAGVAVAIVATRGGGSKPVPPAPTKPATQTPATQAVSTERETTPATTATTTAPTTTAPATTQPPATTAASPPAATTEPPPTTTAPTTVSTTTEPPPTTTTPTTTEPPPTTTVPSTVSTTTEPPPTTTTPPATVATTTQPG